MERLARLGHSLTRDAGQYVDILIWSLTARSGELDKGTSGRLQLLFVATVAQAEAAGEIGKHLSVNSASSCICMSVVLAKALVGQLMGP